MTDDRTTSEPDVVERLRRDYEISRELGFDRAASILTEAAGATHTE